MTRGNFKLALATIRKAKWRSFLTTLGIILGVSSVVIIVSLGEGVKQQAVNQIARLGSDLITVRPGKIVNRSDKGLITGVNFSSLLGSGYLNESDYKTISQTNDYKQVVPFGVIGGVAKTDHEQTSSGFILATTQGLPDVLRQKIRFGAFYNDSQSNQHVAVIGKSIASRLFHQDAPLGEALQIRKQSFVIVGVFDDFKAPSLTPGPDYDRAIFIPYQVGQQLIQGPLPLYQILIKPFHPNETDAAVASLQAQLQRAHGGEDDFTILKQEDSLAVTNGIFNLLTSLIAGIAAISLVVGGIGIMNIMLVSVSERTREIGIRKAVGATNRQVLNQFLAEAIVLSLVGGILGVISAGLVNVLLRITTNIQPVITLPIVLLSVSVALLVGVFFGITPAIKAAHKDPIDALRHE